MNQSLSHSDPHTQRKGMNVNVCIWDYTCELYTRYIWSWKGEETYSNDERDGCFSMSGRLVKCGLPLRAWLGQDYSHRASMTPTLTCTHTHACTHARMHTHTHTHTHKHTHNTLLKCWSYIHLPRWILYTCAHVITCMKEGMPNIPEQLCLTGH